MQDDCPVAYYSRKLNSAQRNYVTIDKERLCVIATLKKSNQCFLVQNCTSTQTTRISSMQAICLNNGYAGFLMQMNMVLLYYRGPTQCYCGYIFKAFAQRCALNISGEESRSSCQQLRVRVITFIFDRQRRNTSVFLEPPMLFYQQGEREKTKEMKEMFCGHTLFGI